MKLFILKKLTAACISVIMIFSVLPFNSAALDKTEYLVQSDFFYNKLGGCEKTVYNAILNSTGGLLSEKQGKVEIEFPKGSELISRSSESSLKSLLDKTVVMALSSIISDHPELYWLGTYSYAYTVKKTGREYKISRFTLTLYPDISWSKTEENYKALLKAASDFEVLGNTDYEKVKYIHDELCKKIFHPEDAKKFPHSDTAYGALIAPYAANCEGYSEAFKLICTLNNIECICIFGESSPAEYIFGFIQITPPGYHEWNYVNMDDGKWYGVDLTWDDQDKDGLYHEFFLSGSETLAPTFGDVSFGSSHKPTGKIYDSSTHLSYPEISKTAYKPKASVVLGDANTDGKITVSDAKAVLQYIAGSKKLSSSQKKNADVNCDGKITVADAKQILRHLAGLKTL